MAETAGVDEVDEVAVAAAVAAAVVFLSGTDHGDRRGPRGVMPVLLAARVVRVPGETTRFEVGEVEKAAPRLRGTGQPRTLGGPKVCIPTSTVQADP